MNYVINTVQLSYSTLFTESIYCKQFQKKCVTPKSAKFRDRGATTVESRSSYRIAVTPVLNDNSVTETAIYEIVFQISQQGCKKKIYPFALILICNFCVFYKTSAINLYTFLLYITIVISNKFYRCSGSDAYVTLL